MKVHELFEMSLTASVMSKVHDLLGTAEVKDISVSEHDLEHAREIGHEFVQSAAGKWLISAFKASNLFAAVYPPDKSRPMFYAPAIAEATEPKIKIPALKPRDPNHRIMAAKRNAAGPMKDKKQAAKNGDIKHKRDLTEGWDNHKDGQGTFTADMSMVDHHMEAGAKLRCPGCRTPLNLKDFKVHKDGEGDTTMWSLNHDCGAKLKIWNT